MTTTLRIWISSLALALTLCSSVYAGPFGDRLRSRMGADGGMQQALGLTADQQQKLRPIFTDAAQRLKAAKDLPKEERRAQVTAILSDAVQKARPILTEEQRAQVAELLEQLGAGLRSRQASP